LKWEIHVLHAEVIAIGDELTSGARLDTNSQWLSERLRELGLEVLYHVTVGDDLQACADVFRLALKRSDVVLVTGGLGPTADDLTREALAAATDTELVQDDAELDHLRDLFARRGREMPEQNVVQAMFPQGSRPIPNPHGTAPGIEIEASREGRDAALLFALPGVPAEMREMWQATVAVQIEQRRSTGRILRHHQVKCFGVGESKLESMLPDVIRRGRRPTVGITVSQATITLRISADGANAAECEALIAPTLDTIHRELGDLVFGAEDDELQHAVVRLLSERGQTAASCEWGTGGMIARWLHAVDPRGERYFGGTVVASRSAFEAITAVDAQSLTEHGPTSEQAARAMAESIRERTGADYGLAVSDFPEPAPDALAPLPFHIALATLDGTSSKSLPFAGHPAILHTWAAKHALNLLRLELLAG